MRLSAGILVLGRIAARCDLAGGYEAEIGPIRDRLRGSTQEAWVAALVEARDSGDPKRLNRVCAAVMDLMEGL